jgi:antirestriction protein ArdC
MVRSSIIALEEGVRRWIMLWNAEHAASRIKLPILRGVIFLTLRIGKN